MNNNIYNNFFAFQILKNVPVVILHACNYNEWWLEVSGFKRIIYATVYYAV